MRQILKSLAWPLACLLSIGAVLIVGSGVAGAARATSCTETPDVTSHNSIYSPNQIVVGRD
jgi:hypothetical protein